MRVPCVKFAFTIAVAALLCAGTAFSQQISGSISGVVKDAQGAVIAGAKLSLVNTVQAGVRESASNSEGIFLFTSLQPATYNLSVESAGFKKYEQREIRLFASDRLNLDIALSVGSVSDSVTVEAEAVQLKTTSAERSGVITGSQVVNLALTTRNFLDLVKTLPGVYYPPGGSGIGGFVNGNRSNQNNLTADGVTNVDTGSNGGVLATMNIDMIGEFKVTTNSQPAEFGRSSGAQIQVVTKSGTRDIHGTGYIFHRHEGLNANNWRNNRDGIQRSLYRYNFAGFNAGGPAYIPGKFNRNKDKLFWFVGMEWQNQLAPNSLRNVTVPTALQRTGNFSQTREGDGRAVTIVDPANGKMPFPGNIVPPNRISADGAKILGFYPQPNAFAADYNYQTQVPDKFPRRENIFRGDYNISDKWRFYSRYMFTRSSQDKAYGQWNADYNIPFAPMNFGNPGWSYIANLTTIINPTLTNEFIFGSSKNVLNIDPVDGTFDRAKLGLAYQMPFKGDTLGLIQNWRYGGVPNAPFTNFAGTPFRNFNHTYDISDNVSKIMGTHTFKAGIYLMKSLKDQTAFESVNGNIWFDRDTQNPGDTGWAFSNALVGNFQRLAQGNTVLNGMYRSWNVEGFVQDNWRLTKRLTLDYGLRLYWIQPQYDAANQTSSFNPSLYNSRNSAALSQPFRNADGAIVSRNPITGQQGPRALIGSIIDTGNGFINGLYANGMGRAADGYPRGLIDDRGIHWAPRIGIAYTPLDKTVIRAGIGVFYDRFQGNPVFDMLTNPPGTVRPTFFYGALNSIQNLSGTFFPGDVRGFDQSGHVPTTINWNLSVQRELPKGVLLDVGYVASRGTHLLSRQNLNWLPFGSAWQPQNQDPTVANPTFDGRTTRPVNLYRPYSGYGNVSITNFGGYSNYNSLQASVNKNLGRGLLFGVAYTWSKTLGVASGDGDTLHPTNFQSADYSYLDFDVPHILTFNYQYELPRLSKPGFMDNFAGRAIFNGWVISGITTMASGQAANIGMGFTGLGGADVNRIYTGSETTGPRVSLSGNPGKVGADDKYIDTSVFRAPVVGSTGQESALRIVRRPGITNWDISVFKNINFGAETRYLQLRLEMFNAPNHTQFADFNRTVTFNPATGAVTNLPASQGGGGGRYGFGAITSARDPRILQLAAKFYF